MIANEGKSTSGDWGEVPAFEMKSLLSVCNGSKGTLLCSSPPPPPSIILDLQWSWRRVFLRLGFRFRASVHVIIFERGTRVSHEVAQCQFCSHVPHKGFWGPIFYVGGLGSMVT